MSMIQESTFEEEVRTAHLDSAHVGDIKGAWGTISRGDTAVRKTWFARFRKERFLLLKKCENPVSRFSLSRPSSHGIFIAWKT